MLFRFKSAATETITMFGNDAVQLLKLMGSTAGSRRAERGRHAAAMGRLETQWKR